MANIRLQLDGDTKLEDTLMNAIKPVFLLSLPRSGSTLLQRLIGAHSHVATAAEPWLLLPPLYALREDGVFAEYGHSTANEALSDFCQKLPGGRPEYLRAVGDMARQLYGELAPPGTTVFLDKTPRYCLVVEDLLQAFPDAPIIILHRNPLAVLASMSETWLGGRWGPHLHKADLYLSLERVVRAQQVSPSRFLSLRYEDLISAPEKTLRTVLSHLELNWEPSLLDSFPGVSVAGKVGDPTGTVNYQSVSTAPLDKWRTTLASPVRKAWCRRYLKWIGPSRLSLMGYALDELLDDLSSQSSDWTSAPDDLVRVCRGAISNFVEPQIVRTKMKAFPQWRDIVHHT